MKNLVRMILLVGFASTLVASPGFAEESVSCPGQFSVEERNMILEEAPLVMKHKAEPSVCFQKLIDTAILRREGAGVENIDIDMIASQLADAAWKAEVSEK